MKPQLLLRIAATLVLLHLAGHTVGVFTWDQAPNSRIAAVIAGMKTEHFDFQGRSVTLAAFFTGYGISMIFVLSFLIVQLWQLSVKPVKNLLLLTALLLTALAISEWIWFFALPAVLSFIAAVCICRAALLVSKSS